MFLGLYTHQPNLCSPLTWHSALCALLFSSLLKTLVIRPILIQDDLEILNSITSDKILYSSKSTSTGSEWTYLLRPRHSIHYIPSTPCLFLYFGHFIIVPEISLAVSLPDPAQNLSVAHKASPNQNTMCEFFWTSIAANVPFITALFMFMFVFVGPVYQPDLNLSWEDLKLWNSGSQLCLHIGITWGSFKRCCYFRPTPRSSNLSDGEDIPGMDIFLKACLFHSNVQPRMRIHCLKAHLLREG